MKKFEKDLKILCDLCKGNNGVIDSDRVPSDIDVDFLCAMGLVHLFHETENVYYDLEITPDGKTYFYRKSEERSAAIRNWSMNILIAILSALFGAVLARLSMVLFP